MTSTDKRGEDFSLAYLLLTFRTMHTKYTHTHVGERQREAEERQRETDIDSMVFKEQRVLLQG